MEYNPVHPVAQYRRKWERRIRQMTPVYTILLVEGRKPTAEHLGPVLNDQGYRIVTARTRKEAWAKVQEVHPAAIVLDSPSLRFSSRRFCNALRDTAPEVPVLMLLSQRENIDRSAGARAYLHYPFSAKKLTRRIARLLPAPDDEVLRAGDILLNFKQRYVIRGGRESHLTPRQARLLETFMRHPGEVLSRAFLMRQVWETDYLDDTRTLDVHVHWVRKAIGEDPKSPVYLRTVRRVGYCFQVPEK
jgi:DNA-binding response OmpR family regulator